jgi:aminopeptidase N
MQAGLNIPGLIILANTLYTSPSLRDFLPTVVAHEVGHQWWYAVVGNDVNQHPWQDEGLTTFSALLYHEEFDPEYYAGTIDFYRQRVASYEQEFGPQPIGQPVSQFVNRESGYAVIVYYKGALFFVDLREEIGDEAFFTALSSYYSTGKFRIVSPYILLNLFEHACACDLSDFYRAYGAIYP